ncbi:hypothetical protein EJB05_38545 [Eragrostis curvula]|uniref:COBRA-like protein n=1 Tax=Eragrostis curvula TaxID=38414 RepID=A0A5J9TUS5_9POAL|nr:hypothetical protein EJB05_38545 [Eragrostis curvula]
MLRRVRNPLGVGPVGMREFVLLVLFCYLSSRSAVPSDAYDPIDPNSNITINWDLQSINNQSNSYTVRTHTRFESTTTGFLLCAQVMVSIHNYQLYRHIEQPGWRLSWNWPGKEVIWGTWGAEATEQGDCRRAGPLRQPPHCCEPRPVFVDLPPGSPYTRQVANCCRGGTLSSLTQDNRTALAAFQMAVGLVAFDTDGSRGPQKPWGFDLGVPGYTCSNASEVPPTRTKVDKTRHVQVLRKVSSCSFFLTWRVICSFSQYREAAAPSCCVSLSTFYNSTIVPCPKCSCACPTSPGSDPSSTAKALQGGDDDSVAPVVRCSDHMCPIRVHWHVKTSYRDYWRVKVTINNYNQVKNYSDWNLVLQHPNLQSLTQLFSFNYKPLIEYGNYNDTGMFWGVKYYNEMLLQDGNVQTEMILKKEQGDFTFSSGWAFPRKVYFDGHECVMPPPDQYPTLPNGASATRWSLTAGPPLLLLLFLFVMV